MDKDNLIQKYFRKTLTEQEQRQFQQLRKSDASFAQAIKEYADLHHAIQATEKATLKAALQELELKGLPDAVASKKYYWRIAIVASVTLLLGIGGYFLWNQPLPSHALYANYFEPYPNVLQPVVRSEATTDDLATTAFLAYENEQYAIAQSTFETLLQTDNTPNLRFYYAMTLQNNGQTDKALTQLIALAQTETRFLPQVYWYTALLYLQKEDRPNAQKSLSALQALKVDYKQHEVQTLLNELR